ncbi:MAG: hypothetical protein E6P95_00345 [Candidatus Moraniibacteriota bacterium]|nr:MAG: hypothetical protein E6P95_00345 [Candidatus Moranbacteria bacterium]
MKLYLASSSQTIPHLVMLFDKKPTETSVVFITTAAKPYGTDVPWMHADIDAIRALGCRVDLLDSEDMKQKELEEVLKKFDVVFVSGGNTYYLLDHVKKSGFDIVIRKLVHTGTIYAGSSAGSIIATPTIESTKDADDATVAPELKDLSALGFVNFCILPHYDRKEFDEYWRNMIAEWVGKELLYLLTDSEAIIVDGPTIKTVRV